MLELTLFFDLRTIKGARIVLFVAATGGYKPGREEHAPVAQRIERLTTDQKVASSNLVTYISGTVYRYLFLFFSPKNKLSSYRTYHNSGSI